MKVQAITGCNCQKNISYKGVNQYCKYGIGALIASSSLFIFSNALDSFNKEKVNNDLIGTINSVASIFGIAGTGMAMLGLKKDDNNKTQK